MTLVIKTKGITAPIGAEKLYRDALVSEGSLMLQDFSNRGSLSDFSIDNGAPVYDLARDISLPLGIDNYTTFKHNLESGEPSLTDGKGVRVDNLGTNPGGEDKLGINLGRDLLNYLSSKTGGILLITWVRLDPSASEANGAFVTSTGDGGGNNFPIRFNKTSDNGVNISFAGAATGSRGSDHSGGKVVQIALEYEGENLPLNCYIDGVFARNSSKPAATFGNPDSDLLFGKDDTQNRRPVMYRWLVEDLNLSGRTADEVVQKDWEYCTGTGEFEGLPTKRPFIDTL